MAFSLNILCQRRRKKDVSKSAVTTKGSTIEDHMVSQSCTTLDPTRGRVRKFAGKGGSGRVQFGQRLKFNFKVSWYLCFILHFSLHNVSAVQYLPCSFQCIGYKATWRMVNLYQWQRHAGMTMLIVRCISCRNVAIIIVLSLHTLLRR